MNKLCLILVLILSFSACRSTSSSQNLFENIGGMATIEQISEYFIQEISRNPKMFAYFEKSDAVRFRRMFSEHLCSIIGGPCDYTGDTMVRVHQGMNISEHDFNLGVDLLINAMSKANVSHPNQNRILALLAPERKNIIYL